MNTMLLDQFVSSIHKSVDRFERDWREKHATKPADFPLDGLNYNEWFEQFEWSLGEQRIEEYKAEMLAATEPWNDE